MRPTDAPYIAIIGGSATFGKFIAKPYPDLLEAALNEVCINLGYQSAGPDVFLQDTAVQSLCQDAVAVVIQIMGAANLSNVFYRVHPRRNDRFIAPTDRLKALYPEVDFTDIAFTGHLIERLRAVDDERFTLVKTHLQKTWITRMKMLIRLARGPVVLLWFAKRTPEDTDDTGQFSNEPAFVTREMLGQLRRDVADIVEVMNRSTDVRGMCFAPLDALAAQKTLNPSAHKMAAKALRGPLLDSLR